MPTLAIELSKCLRGLFPRDPVRIGPLVLLPQSIAGQLEESATLTDALEKSEAEVAELRAANRLLNRDIIVARCDQRDAQERATTAWLARHEAQMAALPPDVPQPTLALDKPEPPERMVARIQRAGGM